MPVMDGAELVQTLRWDKEPVEIIAMSVAVERTPWGFRRAVPVVGANITIGKPFYPAELQAAISSLRPPTAEATMPCAAQEAEEVQIC